MIYLTIQDYYDIIFNDIRKIVYDDDGKPRYEDCLDGIKKLESILELIQNNTYYPDYYKKASYLFITLSTGHNFINGNKRLALFSYIHFTHLNKYEYHNIDRKKYITWFKKHFPNYKISEHYFYSNIGWALYNFNITINIKYSQDKQGHTYTFEQLKKITENFLRFISSKKN